MAISACGIWRDESEKARRVGNAGELGDDRDEGTYGYAKCLVAFVRVLRSVKARIDIITLSV